VLLVASLGLIGSLMLLFGVYLQIDPHCLFIFPNLRFLRVEETSQKIKYGYENYDNYTHAGVHARPFFECPLGMAIRTVSFTYYIVMDMMNLCIACFTYLSLIDLLLLYLCVMIR
jgi:hypothetical protein